MKPRQASPARTHEYFSVLGLGRTAKFLFRGGPRNPVTGQVGAIAFLIVYEIEHGFIRREWRMELNGDRAIELLTAVVADRRWVRR